MMKAEFTIADSCIPVPDAACLAIGNDLVHVPTFKLSLTEIFITKVYTTAEIEYCRQFADPLLRFASTWAAKEAVYKAIKQVRNQTLSFRKIEIIRVKIAGQPQASLPAEFTGLSCSLSISHDGDYAWAIACILKT